MPLQKWHLYTERLIKAEVETHDKNIFGKRSESQLIKLPKQCPGKLDGIHTRQDKFWLSVKHL